MTVMHMHAWFAFVALALTSCSATLQHSETPPRSPHIPDEAPYLVRTPIFPKASKECGRGDLPGLRQDVRLWPNLVRAVLEGKGSLLGRTKEGQLKLQEARKKYTTPEEVSGYIKDKLHWKEFSIDSDKKIWHEQVYKDSKFVSWKLNEHPYELPADVEHWAMWISVPEVSPKFFEPLPGEIPPNPDFMDKRRVKVLVDYLKYHDQYSWYGLIDDLSPEINFNDFAHPTSQHVWVHPQTGDKVNRIEGQEAMKWSGRHIDTAIKSKFPEDKYEVLWNCSPDRLKSCLDPNHIHVFARSKEQFHIRPLFMP